MKKEIKGKEYNIKKLTWGDMRKFGDYLTQEKMSLYSRFGKDEGLENVVLSADLNNVLRQVGLQSDIKMDVLKSLETQLKKIQSAENGVMGILTNPIGFEEMSSNFRSPKGMIFIIWLAIRDNGVKFEDMDSIIDFENAVEVFNFVEIIGLKQPENESKNEAAEVGNPSPLESASLPIADTTE